MILYADASSIIKLYVEETGSPAATAAVIAARAVAMSVVGYVEVRTGLARAYRGRRLTLDELNDRVREFEALWQRSLAVELSGDIRESAVRLAERHPLRSLDAIHLASALLVQSTSREAVTLSAWDAQLIAAASAEGLATF